MNKGKGNTRKRFIKVNMLFSPKQIKDGIISSLLLPKRGFLKLLVAIDISFCPSIKEIPCVALPKLQTFIVDWCHGLELMMHGGVIYDQNFPSLKDMSLTNCPKLKILPPLTKKSGLQRFDVAGWQGDIGVHSPYIHRDGIESSRTTCIFNFFESRVGSDVTTLSINVTKQLIFLLNDSESTAFSGSINLKELGIKVLSGYNMASICRHGVDNCTCYTNLAMDSTSTIGECSTMPRRLSRSFLSKLHGLERLQLEDFDFITSLEELCCLTNLSVLHLEGFAVLERFPDISCLKNLKNLRLIRCSSLEDLPALQNLYSLHLIDCRSLRRLPHSWSAPSLKSLYILRCPALENFQDFRKNCSFLTRIHQLGLDYDRFCSTVVVDATSPDLSNLTHIRTLVLYDFPGSSLSNFKWPQTLRNLCLLNVFNIDELYPCLNVDITGLSQLRYLQFYGCDTVRSLECFICPTNLERLRIRDYKSLEETPDVSNLVNLREISLWFCPSLQRLPGYSRRSGCRLDIVECPHLNDLIDVMEL